MNDDPKAQLALAQTLIFKATHPGTPEAERLGPALAAVRIIVRHHIQLRLPSESDSFMERLKKVSVARNAKPATGVSRPTGATVIQVKDKAWAFEMPVWIHNPADDRADFYDCQLEDVYFELPKSQVVRREALSTEAGGGPVKALLVVTLWWAREAGLTERTRGKVIHVKAKPADGRPA